MEANSRMLVSVSHKSLREQLNFRETSALCSTGVQKPTSTNDNAKAASTEIKNTNDLT
jgi:hypothetical protein